MTDPSNPYLPNDPITLITLISLTSLITLITITLTRRRANMWWFHDWLIRAFHLSFPRVKVRLAVWKVDMREGIQNVWGMSGYVIKVKVKSEYEESQIVCGSGYQSKSDFFSESQTMNGKSKSFRLWVKSDCVWKVRLSEISQTVWVSDCEESPSVWE